MDFQEWYFKEVKFADTPAPEYLDTLIQIGVIQDNIDIAIYMEAAWEAALKYNQQ